MDAIGTKRTLIQLSTFLVLWPRANSAISGSEFSLQERSSKLKFPAEISPHLTEPDSCYKRHFNHTSPSDPSPREILVHPPPNRIDGARSHRHSGRPTTTSSWCHVVCVYSIDTHTLHSRTHKSTTLNALALTLARHTSLHTACYHTIRMLTQSLHIRSSHERSHIRHTATHNNTTQQTRSSHERSQHLAHSPRNNTLQHVITHR